MKIGARWISLRISRCSSSHRNFVLLRSELNRVLSCEVGWRKTTLAPLDVVVGKTRVENVDVSDV